MDPDVEAEAYRRWCNGYINRPCCWITPSGDRAVGFTDGEFRYAMGIGKTWAEAFESADERVGG